MNESPPRPSLDGKSALVTGGAHRVGRALSLALAASGADVAIHYHESGDAATQTAGEIEALGRRAITLRADLEDAASPASLVERAQDAFGRLDILVNNAARFEAARIEDIDAAAWDRVMAVNLRAPYLLARAAAPLLRETKGLIVNIADLSAFQAWTDYPHHAVSKAGLVHLTRVLARALAPEIRVNAIAPGAVLPPADMDQATLDRTVARTPLGRVGTPEDVANALLYLAGAEFVTGEVLVVDGGRLAS